MSQTKAQLLEGNSSQSLSLSSAAVAVGSAGSPSITFTGDLNTGIYSPGADQVAISTGGTGRLFVDASGNVKIGSTDDSNAASRYITVGSVGVTDGGLQLWARTTGSSYVQFGDTTTSADQYRGYMAYLHSSDALTFGTASVERIRVDSSGRVGIGTTNPFNKLVVSNGGASGFEVDPTVSATEIQTYAYNRSTAAYIQHTSLANSWRWDTGSTERARIDSSGRLLVGTSTSTNNVRLGEKLAVVTTGGSDYGGASLTTYAGSTAALSPLLEFQRSRGTTDGSMSAVGNGDSLGQIIFRGATGSAFESAANITAEVDGAVSGAGDIPGRLVFSTTADGASSPTERMRIANDGSISSVIPGGSTLYPRFGCRAWVNFNGTGTVAIRASGNVSSITDNGVGDYTVNFTTALADANYAIVGTVRFTNGGAVTLGGPTGSTTWQQVNSVGINTISTSGALGDPSYANVAIFR
jgi:hypothetical protein